VERDWKIDSWMEADGTAFTCLKSKKFWRIAKTIYREAHNKNTLKKKAKSANSGFQTDV
jgi:hypothetical protein